MLNMYPVCKRLYSRRSETTDIQTAGCCAIPDATQFLPVFKAKSVNARFPFPHVFPDIAFAQVLSFFILLEPARKRNHVLTGHYIDNFGVLVTNMLRVCTPLLANTSRLQREFQLPMCIGREMDKAGVL